MIDCMYETRATRDVCMDVENDGHEKPGWAGFLAFEIGGVTTLKELIHFGQNQSNRFLFLPASMRSSLGVSPGHLHENLLSAKMLEAPRQ